MKQKITLLLVGLFGLCLNLNAQSKANIQGNVKEANGDPVTYANVILHSSLDSSITKVEYTNDKGVFKIDNLDAGSYWVTISYVGLPDFNTEAFSLAEGQTFLLKDVEMKEAAQELSQVTVTATKPLLEIKADKTVFNVEGSVNAAGNSAFELLRKAPGIVIDNNENVTMLGRSGVQIYIDNKPSPLNGADLAAFLKTLNSTEIESIELITNPSSKYDAAGNAGIINIKLKKDKSLGANGSLNLGGSTGQASSYNASINGNYRNKTVNLFGTYSFNDGANPNDFNLYREQLGLAFDQTSRMENFWTSNNFKLGADFFVNEASTVGFIVNGNLNDNEFRNNSRTPISMIGSPTIDSILFAESSQIGDRTNYNFNLNYAYDKDDKSLNIDADYGRYRSDAEAFQPNYYRDATGEITLQERINQFDTPTNIDIYTFKIDHERPFLKGKLGVGVKSAVVSTDNTFNFFNVIGGSPNLDLDRSNQFEYTENVNAAYVNFNRQIKKFGLSLGLRMEQTNSTGDLTSIQDTGLDKVERSYLDFFPSGGVTYAANDNHNLQLNFSRRINRPSYRDLNPFENKLDELTFEKGNPFLNPEYAMNVKFTHTYKYRFNTSVSFSHTQDQIARITDIQGQTASFITWLNLADQYNYSIAFSAPVDITKWWSSFTNFTGFHVRNRADYGEGKIVDLNATAVNFYSQHTFKLPKDYKFEVSGWYNSPSLWEGTFEMRSQYSIDAGIQKQLLDGKANLRVSISDIFKTTNWYGESQLGGLFMIARGGWDSRRVRVNLSYRFGNNQVKSARRRKTGLAEESSRVKG